MIQGCFSNPDRTAMTTTTTSKENLVTCIYLTRLLDSPIHLTLTWSKTPHSHTLTIHAPHSFSLTIPLYPSTFSLFRTRPASKSVHLTSSSNHKIKLYWNFTRSVFTHPNSAEPQSGYYFAIACNGQVEFFLGDLSHELTCLVGTSRINNSAESTQLSRREHVFGRKSFSTRSQFLGSNRLIEIECSGGALRVKIDGEMKLTVKRLSWKFRGNERIMVDDVEVDFFWDVFNWVSNAGNPQKNGGHGVFIFQVGDACVWPEMVGPEKRLMSKSSPALGFSPVALSPAGSSCSSVLQWAEESSDCGRSSSGSPSIGSGAGAGGFSLVLYAWRRR